MMKKPIPIELSLKDQEALLERIRTSMSEKDAEILKGLIDFNTWLQYSLEQKNISISGYKFGFSCIKPIEYSLCS